MLSNGNFSFNLVPGPMLFHICSHSKSCSDGEHSGKSSWGSRKDWKEPSKLDATETHSRDISRMPPHALLRVSTAPCAHWKVKLGLPFPRDKEAESYP